MEVKTRVSKKFTVHIPKSIANAVGLREGQEVRLRVEKGRIVLDPVIILLPVTDPFDLALEGPYFGETTVEEFERESEEWQDENFT
ncbi:MAG: AbrB/MazE/SpoVT family DNA-binding domain-containing protein [Thermoproteus sp.]